MTEVMVDTITRFGGDFSWHDRIAGSRDSVLGWLTGVLATSGWESLPVDGDNCVLERYGAEATQFGEGWQVSVQDKQRTLTVGVKDNSLVYVLTHGINEGLISQLHRNSKGVWKSTDVLMTLGE